MVAALLVKDGFETEVATDGEEASRRREPTLPT